MYPSKAGPNKKSPWKCKYSTFFLQGNSTDQHISPFPIVDLDTFEMVPINMHVPFLLALLSFLLQCCKRPPRHDRCTVYMGQVPKWQFLLAVLKMELLLMLSIGKNSCIIWVIFCLFNLCTEFKYNKYQWAIRFMLIIDEVKEKIVCAIAYFICNLQQYIAGCAGVYIHRDQEPRLSSQHIEVT